MDDLIDVCVRNMVNENFTEEQARAYLKSTLPKLDYWKRYDELSDNGEFEAFKKKLIGKNGYIVFTASIGGTVSHGPGNPLYGMSKNALLAFAKYAAIEFAPRGIRVNCVSPGMIETPLINLDALTDEAQRKAALDSTWKVSLQV